MVQPGFPYGGSIGYTLKRAQSALRAHMDDALRPLGLTTPQYSCLEALNRAPGSSNADLARAVFVTRQSMNTLLRGLEERGLVERASSASGGRALPTTLTADGRDLLTRASALVYEAETAMAGRLGPDRTAALIEDLHACIDALDDQ
ncbi:MarR family winged helix-turn-helix transcriptional regulator [Gordonia sp. (in: high G+C Gram-positive bacteria)]|uniref:MarR family winged helix-turn-helix transcriptional regulator n=1 Tax=Gordonia sp. (in: high G+C Gram-positive bacteria) TaxID=84139 RepID=UPI0035291295